MRTVCTFLLVAAFITNGVAQSITGFSTEDAKAQQAVEQQYDKLLKASNLDQWMKRLAGRPHHIGSPYGKQNAEFMRDLFKSWGYDAEIETYKVLFPTPKVRILEMTAPSRYKAKLVEPALKEDATSGQKSEQLPVYNAWSADGNVTAELVFVNYGIPSDYEDLEKLGIDVKGKVVIAKYGRSWRGIKPKVAQEHGAIGCIIYSDPEEDGYYQGDVYPKGAFKNEYGAQRGSVEDMPVYPGDPLTPGIGATADAKRLDRSEATNLLRIPVLPISYSDAKPLLAALNGPVAPQGWRGALPITYHIGPGPAKVHLQVSFDWKMVDCHNVIAKMKGSEFPDEWVVRGNHHDAWVNGASDPISGMVALLEEARAVSEMVKNGWKPKRTLVYCAWDGEEPGLIGSTEWAEHHADELQQKVVAYINSDSNARGFFGVSGSHTLEPFMNEIARDVTDPQYNISVLQRRKARETMSASTTKAKKDALQSNSMKLGALGSGSDYTPFIQHLGISSLNIGFGGEGSGGDYHSIYDSYDHYKRFKDPKLEYGVALAKAGGRATMRMANASLLPYDFNSLRRTVDGYVKEVTALLDNMREATEVENQILREKRNIYASDPTEKYVSPLPKEEVPYLNFAPLQNAMDLFEKSASKYATAAKSESDNAAKANQMLLRSEQKLLGNGLPRRPWYRHVIYAPGFYTGYGVKTLPGIREAIEQREWKEAQEQIEIAASAIAEYAGYIDQIGAVLKP